MNQRLLVLLFAFLVPISAQAQTIIPFISQQFLTAAGAPCNGCLLDTWAAGTTTAQSTFSDSILVTANANPVVMDSTGRPTTGYIYLSATSYQFRLRSSAGATIWTVDNVTYVPTASGNADVTGTAGVAIAAGEAVYLSDGSGSLTAGRWYLADSDNTYSSTTAVIVGIAPSAIASGVSGTIRIGGRVTGLSGLTAGDIYYAGATAGASVTAPPTNAVCLGKAQSTTVLITPCETPVVRMPDSDGTQSLVLRTSSDLTADRTLTIVTGDVAQTLTLSRPKAPGGRCSLTSGTAVTSADVTAATTLYYTPDSRAPDPNEITLYDGTAAWTTLTLSEISIAVPATTSTMYDVFVYNNAGTVTLELTSWTNDTTRATALTQQNEVYVRTGATTRLYVCSFRTTAVSGQTEDSVARRFVWNYYNRATRHMRVLEATNTWTYTTATLRQANASTANQLDLVVGVAEVTAQIDVIALAQSDQLAANVTIQVGIGEDSTTTQHAGVIGRGHLNYTQNGRDLYQASLRIMPAVGRHFYAWLEYSQAVGITTWDGDTGGTLHQTGIHGTIEG